MRQQSILGFVKLLLVFDIAYPKLASVARPNIVLYQATYTMTRGAAQRAIRLQHRSSLVF